MWVRGGDGGGGVWGVWGEGRPPGGAGPGAAREGLYLGDLESPGGDRAFLETARGGLAVVSLFRIRR